MDWLDNLFSTAQQWLFEGVVQPLMFALGLGNLLEDGFAATGWLGGSGFLAVYLFGLIAANRARESVTQALPAMDGHARGDSLRWREARLLGRFAAEARASASLTTPTRSRA